jgi:hypothetical protein
MGVKSAVIKEAGRPGAALLVPGRGTSASSQLQAATPFCITRQARSAITICAKIMDADNISF